MYKFNPKNDQDHLTNDFFDPNSLKVIIFASFAIIISILLMGGISYLIAKNSVIDKLKTKDLMFITQSISAKIDGRIERAIETALVLSKDPVINEWVKGRETDDELGNYAKQKITDIAHDFDYNNSFIVSALTNHYWAEKGKLIDTVREDDPDDSWFFGLISAKKLIEVQYDYNEERGDTFVFVDVLMGEANKPLAVTGVGLDLRNLAKEFKDYEFSAGTDLWLVDQKGKILLSADIEEIGKSLSDYVPENIWQDMYLSGTGRENSDKVLDYQNAEGEVFDLISSPLNSTDWNLVFQIPRSESLSIINSIKTNTLLGSLVAIFFIVLIFYFVSNKIANPYKRAVLLSQQLEKKVEERTQELSAQNLKITESIEYAKMIQQTVFPFPKEMAKVFDDYFVLWQPKDIVGGDFYWLKKSGCGYILAVGDCTGHGVPGAMMTMAVSSMLNQIVDQEHEQSPAGILNKLDLLLKGNLNKETKKIEDGVEIGIVLIAGEKLVYAGSKTVLYLQNSIELKTFKGDRKTVGYKNNAQDFEFTDYEINLADCCAGDYCTFYLTTDGFIDQNGGEKDYPFGKKRFVELMAANFSKTMGEQKRVFKNELDSYRQERPQRDDITVVGFRFKKR